MGHQQTNAREYASLDAAFTHHRTPLLNQVFVRRFLARIDVDSYFDRGTYIKVTRRSEGPALQIHYGYTNGFRSEQEIIDCAGDTERWASGRATGLWGVTHPENDIRTGGNTRKTARREWGYCETCGMPIRATGRCDNDC